MCDLHFFDIFHIKHLSKFIFFINGKKFCKLEIYLSDFEEIGT